MAEAALLQALQSGSDDEMEYMAAVAPEAMLLPVGGSGSALHWAVLNGSVALVEKILTLVSKDAAGILDSNGMSPAHCAAAKGSIDSLVALFRSSPLACAKASQDGRTLAHYGAPHPHIIEYLVAVLLPSDFTQKDSKGRTPLHYAARGEFPEPVETILRGVVADAVVEQENTCGATPLHWAAEHGCLEALRLLVNSASSGDIGVSDHSGATALHYAARSVGQRRDKLALLLGHLQGDAIVRRDENGQTALHSFAQRSCGSQTCTVEAELLLFAAPRLLDERDNDGRTPLHSATAASHSDLMQLLAKRTSPEHRAAADNYGRTFLHYALASVKDIDLLRDFVSSMPAEGLAVQDSSGQTCLHIACDDGSLELVRLMSDAMPESALAAVDMRGQTALHVAALSCPEASFQLILNKLAPIGWDALDQHGRTPRDLAYGRGRRQIAQLMAMPPKSAVV